MKIKCQTCGKVFYPKPGAKLRSFCSRQCVPQNLERKTPTEEEIAERSAEVRKEWWWYRQREEQTEEPDVTQQLEYCLHCRKVTVIYSVAVPGVTMWRCRECQRIYNQDFDEDEE